MKFRNCTNNVLRVGEATRVASDLLTIGSPMIEELVGKNDFKYDSGDGLTVITRLVTQRPAVKIYFYTPWNPWTKAVGYFDGVAIHINSRKFLSFSHLDLIGLLLHEYAHYCGFKHGNNYKTHEKTLHSVPYFLSENVNRWVKF